MALDANAFRNESVGVRLAMLSHVRTSSLQLPIVARLIVFALCFRVVSATVGFISNVTIPDYQNQGFTVLEQPNPFWDPLRNDPRFQKLCEEKQP